MNITIGLYKGLGDLFSCIVSAALVYPDVNITVVTYSNVRTIVDLKIPPNIKIITISGRGRLGIEALFNLLKFLHRARPTKYLISDHASTSFSPSKLIQVLCCKLLLIPVCGSRDDKFSFLYNEKCQSIRDVELIQKDYVLFSNFVSTFSYDLARTKFELMMPQPQKSYRYVFHLGASTENKRFNYDQLVAFIQHFKGQEICIIGSVNDLAPFRSNPSCSHAVLFDTKFSEMCGLINSCIFFVGFESVASNIANFFGKNINIISGPMKTEQFFHASHRVRIHRSSSPCQSCGKGVCLRKDYMCMKSFNIIELANHILNG